MKTPPYNTSQTIAGDNISLLKIKSVDINHLIEISFFNAVKATTLTEATAMQEKINEDYQHGNSIDYAFLKNSTSNTL